MAFMISVSVILKRLVINMPESIISEFTDALSSVIGQYEPIENTYEVIENHAFVITAADGTQSVVVEPVVNTVTEYSFNWSWAAGAVCFLLMLYSFFRAVGGLLKCKI